MALFRCMFSYRGRDTPIRDTPPVGHGPSSVQQVDLSKALPEQFVTCRITLRSKSGATLADFPPLQRAAYVGEPYLG